MTTADLPELPDVLAAALADAGRTLDDLTVREATELADALRAVVEALPRPTPRDASLATSLTEAADLLERYAGTG
jgi:hypothetical protein